MEVSESSVQHERLGDQHQNMEPRPEAVNQTIPCFWCKTSLDVDAMVMHVKSGTATTTCKKVSELLRNESQKVTNDLSLLMGFSSLSESSLAEDLGFDNAGYFEAVNAGLVMVQSAALDVPMFVVPRSTARLFRSWAAGKRSDAEFSTISSAWSFRQFDFLEDLKALGADYRPAKYFLQNKSAKGERNWRPLNEWMLMQFLAARFVFLKLETDRTVGDSALVVLTVARKTVCIFDPKAMTLSSEEKEERGKTAIATVRQLLAFLDKRFRSALSEESVRGWNTFMKQPLIQHGFPSPCLEEMVQHVTSSLDPLIFDLLVMAFYFRCAVQTSELYELPVEENIPSFFSRSVEDIGTLLEHAFENGKLCGKFWRILIEWALTQSTYSALDGHVSYDTLDQGDHTVHHEYNDDENDANGDVPLQPPQDIEIPVSVPICRVMPRDRIWSSSENFLVACYQAASDVIAEVRLSKAVPVNIGILKETLTDYLLDSEFPPSFRECQILHLVLQKSEEFLQEVKSFGDLLRALPSVQEILAHFQSPSRRNAVTYDDVFREWQQIIGICVQHELRLGKHNLHSKPVLEIQTEGLLVHQNLQFAAESILMFTSRPKLELYVTSLLRTRYKNIGSVLSLWTQSLHTAAVRTRDVTSSSNFGLEHTFHTEKRVPFKVYAYLDSLPDRVVSNIIRDFITRGILIENSKSTKTGTFSFANITYGLSSDFTSLFENPARTPSAAIVDALRSHVLSPNSQLAVDVPYWFQLMSQHFQSRGQRQKLDISPVDALLHEGVSLSEAIGIPEYGVLRAKSSVKSLLLEVERTVKGRFYEWKHKLEKEMSLPASPVGMQEVFVTADERERADKVLECVKEAGEAGIEKQSIMNAMGEHLGAFLPDYHDVLLKLVENGLVVPAGISNVAYVADDVAQASLRSSEITKRTFLPRPWLSLDGVVAQRVLAQYLQLVFNFICEKKTVSTLDVVTEFQPFLAGRTTQEVVSILCELNLISKQRIIRNGSDTLMYSLENDKLWMDDGDLRRVYVGFEGTRQLWSMLELALLAEIIQK